MYHEAFSYGASSEKAAWVWQEKLKAYFAPKKITLQVENAENSRQDLWKN